VRGQSWPTGAAHCGPQQQAQAFFLSASTEERKKENKKLNHDARGSRHRCRGASSCALRPTPPERGMCASACCVPAPLSCSLRTAGRRRGAARSWPKWKGAVCVCALFDSKGRRGWPACPFIDLSLATVLADEGAGLAHAARVEGKRQEAVCSASLTPPPPPPLRRALTHKTSPCRTPNHAPMQEAVADDVADEGTDVSSDEDGEEEGAVLVVSSCPGCGPRRPECGRPSHARPSSLLLLFSLASGAPGRASCAPPPTHLRAP
jgi:hypothetical protein